MIAGLGLPAAYRYRMAKEPGLVSSLFANAVIYSAVVGGVSILLAEAFVPRLVGERSDWVIFLVRVYQVNIVAASILDLMRGLLEGTRRFGWAGAARMIFFGVQTVGFAALWFSGRLTVATAAGTTSASQAASMLLALAAVWHQFRPRWEPSWVQLKKSLGYALRDYPGGVADFTTLRLDQLMLGAMASNVSLGLYVVAVRLSEMTTLAAEAIGDALMPEVAAAKTTDRAESLWARSLRITIYL